MAGRKRKVNGMDTGGQVVYQSDDQQHGDIIIVILILKLGQGWRLIISLFPSLGLSVCLFLGGDGGGKRDTSAEMANLDAEGSSSRSRSRRRRRFMAHIWRAGRVV